MSIITDALRKAEQEHELKVKRAQGEAKVALLEEEKPVVDLLLEQSGVVEAHIEQSAEPIEPVETTASRRFDWFFPTQVREVSALLGIAALFLFVLLLLSYWAGAGKNFSVEWRPFQNGNLFQFNPVHRSSVLSGWSHRSAVSSAEQLPFRLSGISIQEDSRYAIVNDVIAQKGDTVDGAHVKEILEREVVLETRAGEIKLKLQS